MVSEIFYHEAISVWKVTKMTLSKEKCTRLQFKFYLWLSVICISISSPSDESETLDIKRICYLSSSHRILEKNERLLYPPMLIINNSDIWLLIISCTNSEVILKWHLVGNPVQNESKSFKSQFNGKYALYYWFSWRV